MERSSVNVWPISQPVILVFEEKLLINTVGKIIGLQTSNLDSMLIHAARYTARQFVERVMAHFPAEESYSLIEEKLLSYEEFQRSVNVWPISQPAQTPRKWSTASGE